MAAYDPKVDAYIAKAKDFAKPILTHFRELVHKVCPDVEETTKWGMPFFMYAGDNMCMLASFKEHCAFGFWKASLMSNPKLKENAQGETAMGHYGKITSMKELPSDRSITADIKEAMRLNEQGIKAKKKPAEKKKETPVPDYLKKALAKNKKAQTAFTNFPPSHRREYIEWITEAKTEATREKRMVQAIEWIAEGKSRNWKYMKK
jgi:uncharacterized protein YdeI (YjbR/CyaY-like superfamily)